MKKLITSITLMILLTLFSGIYVFAETISTDIILQEDTTYSSLTMTGGILDLNGYTLTINGDFNHQGGQVMIDGGSLVVKGNYLIESSSGGIVSSQLIMNFPEDTVYVDGNLITSTINTNQSTNITDGKIFVKGDFNQKQKFFLASGNSKLVLSGKSNPIFSSVENVGNVEIGNSDSTILLNSVFKLSNLTSTTEIVNIDAVNGNVILDWRDVDLNNLTLNLNGSTNTFSVGASNFYNSNISVTDNLIIDSAYVYLNDSNITATNLNFGTPTKLGSGRIFDNSGINKVAVNGNLYGYNNKFNLNCEVVVKGNLEFKGSPIIFGNLILNGDSVQTITSSNTNYSIGTINVANQSGITVVDKLNVTTLTTTGEAINLYSNNGNPVNILFIGTSTLNKPLNIYGDALFTNSSGSLTLNNTDLNITGNLIQDVRITNNASNMFIQGDYSIQKSDGTQSSVGYLQMVDDKAYVYVGNDLTVNGPVITKAYLKLGTIEIKGNLNVISNYFEGSNDFLFIFSGDNEQEVTSKSCLGIIQIDNSFNSLTTNGELSFYRIKSPNGQTTLKSTDGIIRLSGSLANAMYIDNILLNIDGDLEYNDKGLLINLYIQNGAILNVKEDFTIKDSGEVGLYDAFILVGNDFKVSNVDKSSSVSKFTQLGENSYIYVGNNLYVNASYATLAMQSGVLEVKGNVDIESTFGFDTSHTTLLTGENPQTVNIFDGTGNFKFAKLGINKDISSYTFGSQNLYRSIFDSPGNPKPIFPVLPKNYFKDRHLGSSHVPTGNFAFTETDLSYSAPGFDIVVERTYNSNATKTGLMGDKWHFGYESKIITDPSGDVSVYLSNGSVRVFAKSGNGYIAYDSFDTLEKTDTEYIIRTKDFKIYHYNASTGFLKSVSDVNNKTLTFDVASDGKINKVTDQSGRNLLIEYGSNGLVSKIIDPMGRSVLYNYSGNLLTSYVDLNGETYTYEYDSQGYLSKVKDNAGTILQEVNYDHENSGRVLSKTNALGNTVTYNYDEINKIVQMSDSTGKTSSIGFDNSFDTTSVTDAEGNISTSNYNEDFFGRNRFAQVNQLVDKNNNKTLFEFDSNGNTTKVTNPLNQSSTVIYDAFNNVIESTDVDGNKSYFTYSSDGSQLLKTITPINGTDAYQGIDDKTKFIISTYDYYSSESLEKGLLKSTTSPEGLMTSYTYDENGYLRTSTTGNETTTTIKNMLGWTTSTISPLGFETTYDYDAYGRVIRITDDAGNVSRTVYDSKGNVIQQISPEEYNPLLDNLATNVYSDTSVGIRTHYLDNGLVEFVIDAMGNTTSYVYDIQGNLISETKPNGSISLYEYDVLNRVVKLSFKDNASSNAVVVQETTYTLLVGGQSQVSVKNYQDTGVGNVTITTYDELGRTIKTENPDGSVYQTVYNENGSVQKEIDPKGTEITYVYDNLGRVIETKVPSDVINGTTYFITTKTTYDNNSKVWIGYTKLDRFLKVL